MPWKGVAVNEQREQFLDDWKLNYYSKTDLADRYSVSRKTAHKWIDRFEQHGLEGFHELSRWPLSCPWQTEPAIVQELVELRKAHPHWGPAKLLDLMRERHPEEDLPVVSSVARILVREGLVQARRRHRRAHPGCPKSVPQGPTKGSSV
jgi:transposase